MTSVKYLTFFVFIILSNSTWSQEVKTFHFISYGEIEDIQKYDSAIHNADMENYRCRTVSDTLSFENGLSFVLISAQKLQDEGVLSNIQNYKDPGERSKQYLKPTFKLSPEGILLALYPLQSTKK